MLKSKSIDDDDDDAANIHRRLNQSGKKILAMKTNQKSN